MIVSIKSYFLSHKGRRPNVRRPNGRAPKRPAPKRPCAQTAAPKRRRPNAGAQTPAPKRPAPRILYLTHSNRQRKVYNASSYLYSKFRYLIKSTRDPINISQTVHFFTSYYLYGVKKLRIYAAHTTQTLSFI